jgi:hypothetical protein
MKRMLLAMLLALACCGAAAKGRKAHFYYPRLEGTYVMVKSIPPVVTEDAEITDATFFEGQKISFVHHDDFFEYFPHTREERTNHEMLFYPPFSDLMCRQSTWHYWCKDEYQRIPQNIMQRNINVIIYDADNDDLAAISKLLKPYGITPERQNYMVSFTGGSGSGYTFYFAGRDILINSTYRKQVKDGKAHFTSIVQIFRRTSSTVKTWDGDFRVPAAKKPSGR